MTYVQGTCATCGMESVNAAVPPSGATPSPARPVGGPIKSGGHLACAVGRRPSGSGSCIRALVAKLVGRDLPVSVATPNEVAAYVDWSSVGSGVLDKLLLVTAYGVSAEKNHVEEAVSADATVRADVIMDDSGVPTSLVATLTVRKFFTSSLLGDFVFNADNGQLGGDGSDEAFGGGLGHVFPQGSPPAQGRTGQGGVRSREAGSTGTVPAGFAHGQSGFMRPVVEPDVSSGSSNVGGGVKRAVRSLAPKLRGLPPRKSYVVSDQAQFNNIEELVLDRVSPDVAQGIVESFFSACQLPLDQPDAMRYAEDLLAAFLIARTASDKADWNASFEVPVKPFVANGERISSVEVDFAGLSDLLSSEFTCTRRQFARGYADTLRKYLLNPENSAILPVLADRAGCELQMANLAFDGSTGCTGKTVAERQFATLLESRNLFESDEVLANDASKKLMMGRY